MFPADDSLEAVTDCRRASDRERESAAKALRAAYAAGRLDLDEFQDRIDGVFAAKTWAELGELTEDLPEGSTLSRSGFGRCSYHRVIEVYYEPKHPFAPVWWVALSWLAIGAVAHVAAAIPLVLLSLFVLGLARWSRPTRRRPPDSDQPGKPPGS
jgi:hypothetical protein